MHLHQYPEKFVLSEQVGDRVGVGCIVDSCRDCAHCSKGLEQYCGKGMVGTYNSQVSIDLFISIFALCMTGNLRSDYMVRAHGAEDKGPSWIRLRGHVRRLLPIGNEYCEFPETLGPGLMDPNALGGSR